MCVAASLVLLLLVSQWAAAAEGNTAIGFGTRMRIEHSQHENLPHGDGDLSYAVALEWHESEAYWQLAVDFAPKPSESNTVDYVLTPQLSLILKDQFWRGGIGLLWSLVEDENEGGEWTDLYYQFMFGVSMPVYRLNLDIFLYYYFEDWDELADFDFTDIEFGVWLGFMF